ncbi:MAG TPA: YciI family protein [Candidatus Limnocylindrales bacterium]|nr:YciI family protein [Candidatus Limnocylindrales bacterium]
MRYLLLIYTAEPTTPPAAETMQAQSKAYAEFTADIRARGVMQAGEALEPTTTATTVRVRDGRTITTDGPFAETKEALGGFYLIEARDLDDAIEVAARIPGAAHGSIEVRPIWERPDGAMAATTAASAGAAQH